MRASEWVVCAFFCWASVLALVLPIAGEMRTRALFVNALVLLFYVIQRWWRHHEWAHMVRDWFPQGLIVLGYKEMGWFAPGAHDGAFEQRWIGLDRLLLNDWRGRDAIEALGALLPGLLELSYLLVYAVPPITMVIIYSFKKHQKSDVMLTIYLLGMFACYAQFPFWPSEPPRVVFAGQDLPRFTTMVRDFNLRIVGGYGIHTSVFPSAHVAGAVAAACGMLTLMREKRLLVAMYWIYAVLVAVATVYGRYHFAIDAIAGAAYGVAALPAGAWLTNRVGHWAANASGRRSF